MDVAQTVREELEKEEPVSAEVESGSTDEVSRDGQETRQEQLFDTNESVDGSSAPVEPVDETEDWHLDLGPEYAGLTEEQTIARLEQEREYVARVPQLEQQNQQLQNYLYQQQQQIAAWQAQQQQAQFAAQQQEQARQREVAQSKIPPELTDSELSALIRNDKGELVAKEGYPSDLPAKYAARQQYERQQLQRLISGDAQREVESQMRQEMQQNLSRIEMQFKFEQFDRENGFGEKNWLWLDRASQTLTKYGQLFVDNARYFFPLGMDAAFAKAKEIVTRQAELDQARQMANAAPPPAVPTPSQTQAQRDMALLRTSAQRTSGAPRKTDGRSLPVLGADGKFPNIRKMLADDFELANVNGIGDW